MIIMQDDEKIVVDVHHHRDTDNWEATISPDRVAEPPETCKWAKATDGAWETECENWTNFDIPGEGMRHCPFCGELIEVMK